MKITENQLKQIIDEEIQAMIESGEIDEGFLDRMKARGSGAISKLKTGAAGMVQKGLGTALGAAGKMGGGDAATKAAADMKQAAADTKTAGADKAEATKTLSILNSHLKAMVNDLTKLGIDLNQPGVKGAVANLQKAVSGTIAKRAAEQ